MRILLIRDLRHNPPVVCLLLRVGYSWAAQCDGVFGDPHTKDTIIYIGNSLYKYLWGIPYRNIYIGNSLYKYIV